jgi:tetratricopeptide (TPR) repeat protein
MRNSLIAISFAAAIMMNLAACDRGGDDADTNLIVAENYLRKNDVAKAEKHYQNVLDRDNQSLPALYGLATIAEKQGQYSRAESYYQQIIAIDSNSLVAHMRLARIFLATKRVDAALNKEEILATVGGDELDTLLLRLNILSVAKKQQEANEVAQKLLDIASNNKQAYVEVIHYYQTSGQANLATELLARSLIDFPDEPEFYRQKMLNLFSAQHFDDIETLFPQYIEEKPQLEELYFLLADYYINRNNSQAAVSVIDKLVQTVNLNEDVIIRSAQAYNQLGQQQAALALLKNNQSTFSQSWRLQLMLAEEYADNDQRGQAESIYSSLKSQYPTISTDADDASTSVAIGYSNFKRYDDVASAEKMIDEVLLKQPDNREATLLKAQLLNKQKKYRTTITELRGLLSTATNDIAAILLTAEAHGGLQQYDSAVAIYEAALDKAPNNKLLIINYLQILLTKGDLAKAYDKAQQWLKQYPNDIELLEIQAQIALASGSYDKLFSLAATLQSIQGKKIFNRYIEGVAYANDNQHDKAISILKEVNSLDVDHYPSALGLIQLYAAKNQLNVARDFFEKLKEKSSVSYFSIGRIHSLQNQRQAANDAFKQSITLSPTEPRAYLALADNYFKDSKYQQVEEVLRSALNQVADNAFIYYQLGGVLLQQEKFAEAISAYKQAVDLEPTNILAANNYLSVLSDHYTDRAELQSAESVADRLLDVDDANIKDTLGWFYYHLGDNYKATLYTKAAIDKQPDQGIFHFHLGMIYKRQLRDQLAQEALKKAIELAEPNEPWLKQAQAAL